MVIVINNNVINFESYRKGCEDAKQKTSPVTERSEFEYVCDSCECNAFYISTIGTITCVNCTWSAEDRKVCKVTFTDDGEDICTVDFQADFDISPLED